MIGQHTLDTQEIEHLQNIVLNSQSPSQNHSADNHSSSVPLDNAQRPPSSSHYQALHLSQLRMSESGESQSEQFQFLGGDSFPYHRHRLGIESQVDDISPSPSLSEYHPQLTSISYPPQGGDGTPFKVPSFPSISSIIRNSRSSDENGSSVQTAGEASPRLSQFFHPTQESPPQLHSSPHQLPLLPDSIPPIAPPDPSPIPPPRAYTPIAVLEARERARAEEAAAAEEARRRAEEDSFTTVPEHLRRRWAMEEKAHKMFEGLRNVKIDLKSGRGVGNDSQIDDFMFGTKSRVDPDGVRRVIKPEPKKTVSETGLESDGEGEEEGARKRASTAPVREKKGSTSTVISNSQPSNPSNGDTNGTVVKETPLESTPVSRPVTADAGGALDSSQLIDIFEQQGDLVTPARTTTSKNIPSSIPSSSRRVMETPAVKHIPAHHHHDESVPETSPVKEIEGTESQEYRTARSSFPQEIDSSPVIVPGRSRAKNGFVASSIPHDMTQRKRGRAPVIQDDVSEEEEDEPPPPPAISPPPRKRRRVKSTELVETTTSHVVSPSVTSFENGMETHRVFARFKDHKNNFFPATVVEPPVAPPDTAVPLETAVLVRFDDDMETMVELRHIRRLHLIEGITVKLAIPEYSKRIYIVRRVEYDPKETGKPDINNDNIVYVTPKKGTDEIRVPIDKVFVTGQLFAQFKEPYLFTSTSPTRTKYPGLISRQVSSSPRIVRGAKTSLFQNMVFAISLVQPRKSTSAATSKETLTQTIVANCGYVVHEGGLQEIFHPADDVEGKLVLQPDFEDTTFCAVIADGYSRRTKYLQALALGIPCLASRWIESCIQKNRIVDWRMYLLPAGESTFLGGIKSMVVEPFPPTQLLSEHLSKRYVPLQDEKILIVMGKGKTIEAKRNYHFIVHTLGARKVYQCTTLGEVDAFLSQGGFTLVIADELDVKKFGMGHVSVRLRSFENVIQSLILGDFVDEI